MARPPEVRTLGDSFKSPLLHSLLVRYTLYSNVRVLCCVNSVHLAIITKSIIQISHRKFPFSSRATLSSLACNSN